MSKLVVKSGKTELRLRKSSALVGLKTTGEVSEKSFVEAEVHKNLGGFSIVTLRQGAGETVDAKLDEVRRTDDVETGTHVYFAEGSNRPLIPTGEIFITFHPGVSEAEQAIVLEEFQMVLTERRAPDRIAARVTDRSPNPIKVAAALQGISLVKYAEPDLDTVLDEYAFAMPADHLLRHQWHLSNSGTIPDSSYSLRTGADAKVVDAWRRLDGLGNPQIVIAIIDNGFDLNHPDLKDKVTRPFDLWNQTPQVLQGDPRYTHGTPCAGIALAAANGNGMVGAAPQARFMPVSGTSFSLRHTEQMFDYCIQNGADIISCSWGTTDAAFALGPDKENAISKAARLGRNGKGCVVLFAVGNEDLDYVSFYATHPDVIAVAASTSRDEHARYSNRGRHVSVCAPSNGDWPVISTRAWWDPGTESEMGPYKYWRDGISRGNHYKHFGGTSAATPLVAGICALMLSANPDLTARAVKEILQQTADKIGSPSDYINGHSVQYGYGRVNADRAVAEALRRKQPVAPINTPAAPVSAQIPQPAANPKGLFRFDVRAQAAEGWTVQIGVFYDYGNVLQQAERMNSRFGHPSIVQITQVQGKTAYRVSVGAFKTADEAKALQQRMAVAGVTGFAKNLKELT
jgi:subtilisin family serine protease